ncbi:hypothetical protein [Streptosporangium sp. KLBMP 9127]|nr:hypothetical protein [Streptosporangium sp. KLBMP 9127]
MSIPPLPIPVLGPRWHATTADGWSRTAGRLLVTIGGIRMPVLLERCAAGRLRDAYPVSGHDTEVRFAAGPPGGEPARALLRELAGAIQQADPLCRRVVCGATVGDDILFDAAQGAGFRYVVTVDVAAGSIRLFVAEPAWVTAVDLNLDQVPQT